MKYYTGKNIGRVLGILFFIILGVSYVVQVRMTGNYGNTDFVLRSIIGFIDLTGQFCIAIIFTTGVFGKWNLNEINNTDKLLILISIILWCELVLHFHPSIIPSH